MDLALEAVVAAAESIEADLSGNADTRIRGLYIMIEAARVRRLLDELRTLRATRQAKREENYDG